MSDTPPVIAATETFDQVIGEIQALFPKHWEENAFYKDIPLDPDYEFYAKADKAGMMRIYTLRRTFTEGEKRSHDAMRAQVYPDILSEPKGELVGYAVFFLRPSHIHYRNTG